MWILRHAIAIIILPGTVCVMVPRWIAARNHIAFANPQASADWLSVALGALLLLAGLTLFLTTLKLFATEGRGTLAPWDPPARLVVAGPYRYVRNPMISGVLMIVFAEALILRSLPHAQWGLAFFLLNAIYFPLSEEPGLEHRFGEEYRQYKRHVRRFVPRLRPYIT